MSALSFSAARKDFADGRDDPRAFLERCLAAIEAREPTVRAWVTMNVDRARREADESAARWRAGRPLSIVDGLPIGVKDLIFTADMPTQMNSPIFSGWRSERDAACVWWLRKGGALVLGKTVTTEFGVGASGPTTNPHDERRTPGGSSSGSAAAVAAGMVPVALGTQAMGSIVRPSSYCGTFGFKPGFGALNRGGIHGLIPSQAYLGTHAATLEDMWEVAAYIAETAGGDPGHPGLGGGLSMPAARRPARLLRLKTADWEQCDDGTKSAFEALLDRLRRLGIEIIEPEQSSEIRAFESDFADWIRVFMDVVCWEMRWPMAMYAEGREEEIGERATGFYRHGLAMTRADYAEALRRRQGYRDGWAEFAAIADAVITPSTTGPAPEGLKFTGPPAYNAISSGLQVPAISLPMLAVGGLPVGVQIMGFRGHDAALGAIAAWIWGSAPGADEGDGAR
jgi:Asp-tRNA(Asn)/Glu-tRNA(Gln) amidotransferase A subunit family amidase